MRKEGVLLKVLCGLATLWVLLTGYKVLRRAFMPKRGKEVLKASGPRDGSQDAFYEMPKTKEERRAELGRGTWALIHTIAAKYPPYASREHQSNLIKFIDLLTKLFPCEECRGHFKSLVDSFPPKVSSREEFGLWTCQAHNIVNKRLGKREFDCTRLDDRWDCGCK
ncbi:mitochondrial FAD-linked sulfhydryl oxidase [Nematocida minor]|uniref:mitochondrial FAD-linked sulfhydryl oxidase n=1 Tax=Nematocida minor TaxID=1912983 RepID=UPI00221EAB9B|nr:mitochondrial FAD-linked sulfhydryl oxidase [Nematocida minor]KAI5190049.1 mitochondrial FAD-linked sulfhydryl oxidase [Nematocida minor]